MTVKPNHHMTVKPSHYMTVQPFLNIVQPWEVHLVKKAQNQLSLRLSRKKLKFFFKE
jgi:hypothetical protein